MATEHDDLYGRKLIGRRIDGLISFVNDRTEEMELGAIEASTKRKDQFGSKYLSDRLKMGKSLKDMLGYGKREFRQDSLVLHGILQSQMQLEFSRMKLVKKNFAVWGHDRISYEIYHKFSPQNLKIYLKLLCRLWAFRLAILENVNLLESNNHPSSQESRMTNFLLDYDEIRSPTRALGITDTFQTPVRSVKNNSKSNFDISSV